jgi:hypothetical protein
MICADTSSRRAFELYAHGGESWERAAFDAQPVRLRALASACSFPALAIAACGLAGELGLDGHQAEVMAAYVPWRTRKQVAAAIGISEATVERRKEAVERAAGSDIDAVAIEVLRRAVARPLINRGR